MDVIEYTGANSSALDIDLHATHNATLCGNIHNEPNYSGQLCSEVHATVNPLEDTQAICHTYDFVIEAVLMGMFCLFGFCGNTLSMICLSRDKSRTATPFLLVSLEAVDTFFLLNVLVLRVLNSISTYFRIVELLPLWPYVGKYIYPSALIAETGTIYLTLLVTVNRYVMVCKPYDASSLCSVPHARTHVLLVLAFSIVYNIPRFFEYSIEQVPFNDNTNSTIWAAVPSSLSLNTLYQIIYLNTMYFIVMFFVPLILLIYLNSSLIIALRQARRRRAQLISNSDSHNKSEDDITLVLIVVVIVFIVCQTPALVTQVLRNVLSEDKRECNGVYFFYERISDLLVVGNSSLNFIIYCFCSTKFRQILISLVCKNRSAATAGAGCRTVIRSNDPAPKSTQYTPLPLQNTTENGITTTQVNGQNNDNKDSNV